MGKASRNKTQSAREKIAAQREAARRAEQRKRIVITAGSVLGVAAVVAAFILVKAAGGSTPASAATTLPGTSGTAASVLRSVASVPAATLDSVGPGSGQLNIPKTISGAPLTRGGKPEILYMGAEYCPFCAAERWSLTVALSRFGTFSNVGLIHSSSTDVYPSTPTLTFYKSSYTSAYLSFVPVEMQTVTHANLQQPTAQQNAVLNKYDAPPYVPSTSTGAIPFVDVANQYALVGGSSYLPQVLKGRTWQQIAAALRDPASPIARQVDGAANYLTAAICKATHEAPASVCASATITSLQGQI